MADRYLDEQNKKSDAFWRKVDEAQGRRIVERMAEVSRLRREGYSDDQIDDRMRR